VYNCGTKYLHGFINLEVNSDSEQTTEPNPWNIQENMFNLGSRASSVSIVYELDNRDSVPGRGGDFFFLAASRPAQEPIQPPIQCVTRVLSPKIKRLGP